MEKTKEPGRIGIMGGTFNPIHYGHLVTGEEALYQFHLDKIIFMPSGMPPHKADREIISTEERYIMTVIATAANPNFSVSRFEVEREGPSYTIETLKAMRAAYPESEMFFITGADAVLELLTWREPEKLFNYGRFIAATRPGFDIRKVQRVGKFRVAKSGSGEEAEIYVMEIPALSVSSTEIRQRIREGKPVRYLIPDGVLEYIIQRELYRGHAISRKENIR